MATRKPLVTIAGQVQELPAGDLVAGVGTFPFYKSDGTSSPITLTADSFLPFFKADGSASNIPMTT